MSLRMPLRTLNLPEMEIASLVWVDLMRFSSSPSAQQALIYNPFMSCGAGVKTNADFPHLIFQGEL